MKACTRWQCPLCCRQLVCPPLLLFLFLLLLQEVLVRQLLLAVMTEAGEHVWRAGCHCTAWEYGCHRTGVRGVSPVYCCCCRIHGYPLTV